MFSKKFMFFIFFIFLFNFCSSFKSSNKSISNSLDKKLVNSIDKKLINSNNKRLLNSEDKKLISEKRFLNSTKSLIKNKDKNLIIIKKIPKIKNEIHKQKSELKKLLKRIEKSDRMLRIFENDHLNQNKNNYDHNKRHHKNYPKNDQLRKQHLNHHDQFKNQQLHHSDQFKKQQFHSNEQLKKQHELHNKQLKNQHELHNQLKNHNDQPNLYHTDQFKNENDNHNNQYDHNEHKNQQKNKMMIKNTHRVINHSPIKFEQKVPIQITKLKNQLGQLRALKNYKKEEKEYEKKFLPNQNIWNIETNTSLPIKNFDNFEDKKNLTNSFNQNDLKTNYSTKNLEFRKPNDGFESQVFSLNSKNVFIVPDLVNKMLPLKNLDEHYNDKGFIPSLPMKDIENLQTYQKLKVSSSEPQIKKYTLQSYPMNNQLQPNEFNNYYGPNYPDKNYYPSKENLSDNFETEKISKKPYSPSNYYNPIKPHLVQPVQILVQLPKTTASHLIPEKNPHYHYVFINNNQLSKDELPYKENDYHEKFYKKKAENYIPKNIYSNKNRYVKPYTVYYQNPIKNINLDSWIETKIEDETKYKKNDVKKNLFVVYSPEEKISKIEDEIKYVNHHFLENEEKSEDYKNYHDYMSSEELNSNLPETSNEDLNKLFSDNSFYNKDDTVTDNYINSATQEEIINQPINYLKKADKKFNKVIVKNENKLTNFSEGQEFMFKYNEPIYQSIIKNNYQNNKKIKNIEEDNLNYESIYHPENNFRFKTDTYKPNIMHKEITNENQFKPINLQKNSSLNDNKLSLKKIEIPDKKPVDTNFENEQVDREQVYLFRNGISHHSVENVYFPSDLENESSITEKKTLKKENKDKLENQKEIIREFNSETEFLNQNHKDTSSIFKYNAYDSYLLDNYGKAGLFPFKT